MKKIGFLSFGHWNASRQSATRSARDVLHQSIELAIAAEELGADGAYFRVHHFAQQLASPFALLAAIGTRTSRIEIGTGVIDMRYENPFYMIEDAGAADLISNGRLQLGISRGSPEQVIEGWRHFGYTPPDGGTDADLGRHHAEVFLELLKGEGFARPNPRPMFPNPPGLLRLEPHSPGLRDRIWWGSASNGTAAWAARHGMNLQSSTLKDDEDGRRKAAELDLSGVAERIQQPYLAITGRLDRLIPWEQTERGAREAPNGTFLLHEDGNHGCANVPYKTRPVAADWLREQLG